MEHILPIIGDADVYAANNPFMAHNHIEITRIDREEDGDYCAEVRVVLRPESMNLHGAVHGGLLYGLADCVAGIVSRTDGADYVTQSAHMNFLHNVQSGTLYAATETVRRGHKLAIFHVTVTDEKGDLLIDGVVDMFRITP